MTSDLVSRVYQHREYEGSKFTSKYNVKQLVYFELFEDMDSAIVREKQLKKWNRKWKLKLIEQLNPQWNDLWTTLIENQ